MSSKLEQEIIRKYWTGENQVWRLSDTFAHIACGNPFYTFREPYEETEFYCSKCNIDV